MARMVREEWKERSEAMEEGVEDGEIREGGEEGCGVVEMTDDGWLGRWVRRKKWKRSKWERRRGVKWGEMMENIAIIIGFGLG